MRNFSDSNIVGRNGIREAKSYRNSRTTRAASKLCAHDGLRAIANDTYKVTKYSSSLLINYFYRDEASVDLSKMFLVTNFPTSFTTDMFLDEKRFGPSVRVKWINDTSCLVTYVEGKEPKDGKEVKKETIEEITKRVKEFSDWWVAPMQESAEEPVTKKLKVESYAVQ